jgi:hypothetical protein
MHPLRYAFFCVITQRTVGNSLPTFRDNQSGPIFVDFLSIEDGIGCPETSVSNYNYTLRNDPKERRISSAFAAQA